MPDAGVPDEDLIDVHTSSPRGNGATFVVREGTSDAATIHSTFHFDGKLQDEYGLRDLHLEGWAIDVGAHVGTVAVALAIDNPSLRVIAVEAVPENAALVAINAERNGVADRVHVIAKAASGDEEWAQLRYGPYEVPGIPPDHAMQVRFIGNLFRDHGSRGLTVRVPAVSLEALLDEFGIDRVAFMKIDCEGCEWAFLSSPAIDRVDLIHGEWHDRAVDAITGLLAPTHRVEVLVDDGGVGMFRATRR